MVQEREISLLTNDTGYYMSFYNHQEQNLKLTLENMILTHDFELKKLELEHLYQKNALSMTTQLTSEQNIVMRDGELKKQELRKHLIAIKTTLNEKLSEHQRDISLIELQTKNELLKERFLAYESSSQETLLLEKSLLEAKQKLLESTASYEENTYKIKRNNESNIDELNLTHERITLLLNQLNALYRLNHNVFAIVSLFYKTPAHPDDFKAFVRVFSTLLMDIQTYKNDCLDSFLVDMKTYHEQKITDTTGYKFDANMATIEETYQTTLSLLNTKTLDVKKQIKHHENQIIIKHAQADRIQLQLNNLEKVMVIVLN